MKVQGGPYIYIDLKFARALYHGLPFFGLEYRKDLSYRQKLEHHLGRMAHTEVVKHKRLSLYINHLTKLRTYDSRGSMFLNYGVRETDRITIRK